MTHSLPTRRLAQYGFSLIELMVAVTLGLLIMTALVSLFINTSRTNTEMAKTYSQIENGRFVMQLLQNDLVHAGFWGGYVPEFDDLTASATDAPEDVPSTDVTINPTYDPLDDPMLVPCEQFTSWDTTFRKFAIGIPTQAYDAVPSGCTGVITNKKTNSDVLIIRHASTCLPGVDNCEADTAGKLYFQFSRCETEISDTPPLIYVLDTIDFTLKKKNCTISGAGANDGYANKRKFISYIYYIRDFSTTAGDGIPTLMRSEFDNDNGTLAFQPAVPLVNGIESLRVEFGIDNISDASINIINSPTASNRYTAAVKWADPDNLVSPVNRGDGSPDTDYVRCTTASPCTVAQMANVVAVKLYILARSDRSSPGYTDTKTYCLGTPDTDGSCPTASELGPFNDSFKRHVFSTTVRLNNISGRRETP
jgi:type IV pilus assembly protein PilW